MRRPSFERFWLGPIVLWLALGAGLAAITGRVTDWFVMTDELLYERLALSVIRLHSPMPRIHGELVGNLNQLYPLVLATAFRAGDVGQSLHRAHVLNAFVMSSASVPAYLLARRVAGPIWTGVLAALLSVAVPWIVLSSFLLTEVAAYPAFLWVVLAFQAAVVEPSHRRDALAAAAIVLAILARTQFAALAFVLPLLIVLDARSVRTAVRAHRVLAAAYAAGVVAAVALVASGHSLLGTYATTAHGNPLPSKIVSSFAAHLATIGLGLGIVPFLIGGAWLAANAVRSASREQRIFALLASVTIVLLTLEVASYDLRFGGGGIIRDRYLFYIVPLLVVAFVAALASDTWPRRSLAIPLIVLIYGFAREPLPLYDKFNVDTPVAILDNYLRGSLGGVSGARIFLIGAAVVGVVLVLEGTLLLRRAHLAVLLAGLTLIALPAETGYAFTRLLGVDGTSGRPLTTSRSSILGWVDQTVGRNAHVTAIPFPTLPGYYWSGVAYWWDLEFWNESVDRSAGIPNEYGWTPSTFPKLELRFDSRGRTNVSPPGDVAQAIGDTRFHIAGTVLINDTGVFLVKPEEPWRADWVTSGLYDDGWTKPQVTAHIRVFPYPGQTGRVTRSLTIHVESPSEVAGRSFKVVSNIASVKGTARTTAVATNVTVCVPPTGSSEIRLSTPVNSYVYGDPTSELTYPFARHAGVHLTQIYLSGQIGSAC